MIKSKDHTISNLEGQITKLNHQLEHEKDKAFKEQKLKELGELQIEQEKDEHDIAQDFFIRFANYLFKKKKTLYGIIHTKIFDKMLNGVEVELINVDHFWRLIEKSGFRTVKKERSVVTNLVKNKILNNIFEVKSFSKILGQLGISEDIPKSTKNFNYDDLSGCGIRIINRILRSMRRKTDDIVAFLGAENIEKIEVVASNKSEIIEIISAENFLRVLRNKGIMKRWEDLDENLQTFLGVSSYMCEKLMIRKIKKCVADFKNCEFFEYYG